MEEKEAVQSVLVVFPNTELTLKASFGSALLVPQWTVGYSAGNLHNVELAHYIHHGQTLAAGSI